MPTWLWPRSPTDPMRGDQRRLRRGGFRHCRAALFAWGLLVGLLPIPSWADGLQVTPVLLEFDPGQRALAVWLSNSSQRPLHAQARVQAWTQVDGKDVLDSTTEVIASPPLVEIPPGQTQVIRIVRSRTERPETETAYRLLVDELPRPEATAPAAAARPGGIKFLFRYSIPVFIQPRPTPEALPRARSAPQTHVDLSARWESAQDGQAQLTIQNLGPTRIKLSDLSYTSTDGEQVAMGDGLFGYVLARQTRQWTLPAPVSFKATGGTLKARLNEDSNATVLAQDPPPR